MLSTTVQVNKNIKKRLFIGLLGVSLLVLVAIFSLACWLITKPDFIISRIIFVIGIIVTIVFFLLLIVGIAALVWSLWQAKDVPSLQSIMYTATTVLFPLALTLGKWAGLEEEKIKNSYIQVSNQLVRAKVGSVPIKRVMILAPHCLQWVKCPNKITIDVNNCKGCGRCPVDSLIKLAARYNCYLVIATGGTFARKAIKEYKPQAVVAIACERDLTSGIQDVSKLPVLGIVNERPEGPCRNTNVDLKKVEEAIKYFQQGG